MKNICDLITSSKEYGDKEELEFHMKIDDDHRRIFPTGDWTDDTDQMILIMQSITQQKGNVRNIWDKVFKNGPNKVCRRQS